MKRDISKIKENIIKGRTALGIELGSTRIKSVLIDDSRQPIAIGKHDWDNKYIDSFWTYSLEDVWTGIQASYRDLAKEVKRLYDIKLENVGALGISAMMHGYLAFDKDDNLLTPFRTWRNTTTGEAAGILTNLFEHNIPQRWSIAHLYQAILNDEDHVGDIDFLITLAGYVHWKLTGKKVLGIGDAVGMFPVDSRTGHYNENFIKSFHNLIEDRSFSWKLENILPDILKAGENAGYLSEEGARLLDPSGNLKAGIALCPPEGDAGTGMVATNSVAKRTGNVSAGTSIFAMIVLEEELKGLHEEIDLVTTPAGDPVAMVHSNNCTSDFDAWAELFREFAAMMGLSIDSPRLYDSLYFKALEGDKDLGGLLNYGYLSGEHITGFEEGRPLFTRLPDSNFNLANFMKSILYSTLGALRIGMDILSKEEEVEVDSLIGHGGFFKAEGVGQKFLAAATRTPVTVMDTAGEGGAWGIALLADFMQTEGEDNLAGYLNKYAFIDSSSSTLEADEDEAQSFDIFLTRYIKGFPIERAAIDNFK